MDMYNALFPDSHILVCIIEAQRQRARAGENFEKGEKVNAYKT